MIEIHPIPAFDNNYFWIIYNSKTKDACIIDPGDAKPVNNFLNKNNLNLTYILITHHHWDHTGGVSELKKEHKSIVFGPNNPKIKDIDNIVSEQNNNLVNLEKLNISFKVLDVPGHTLDHVAYFSNNTIDVPVLFCGDTLFSGGCGRLFEGSATQMQNSLSKISSLLSNTNIYCAHEYTLSNLKFAESILPSDQDIKDYINHVKKLREKNTPSLPSNIKQEKLINLFLRCDDIELQTALDTQGDSLASFTKLRELKDNF
jgi:hydroxyacylglutathione hydrolase